MPRASRQLTPLLLSAPKDCHSLVHHTSHVETQQVASCTHELVEASSLLDDIWARLEEEVIRVAKHELLIGEGIHRAVVDCFLRRHRCLVTKPHVKPRPETSPPKWQQRWGRRTTGTNPGVSMTPCGVWMRPTRASDTADLCTSSYLKYSRSTYLGKLSALGGGVRGSMRARSFLSSFLACLLQFAPSDS